MKVLTMPYATTARRTKSLLVILALIFFSFCYSTKSFSQLLGAATGVTISGDDQACPGDSRTYTLTISGTTNGCEYEWAISGSWGFFPANYLRFITTSDPSVTVEWEDNVSYSSTSYLSVSVKNCDQIIVDEQEVENPLNNARDTKDIKVIYVTDISSISGSSNVECGIKTLRFCADPGDQQAGSYEWSVPSGWQIIDKDDNCITVTTNANSGGSLCVQRSDDCGRTTNNKCKTITRSTGSLSTIQGVDPICVSDEVIDKGGNRSEFFVVPVSDAQADYNWYVDNGSIYIESGNGTPKVTVVAPDNQGGTLCVFAQTACGSTNTICREIRATPLPPQYAPTVTLDATGDPICPNVAVMGTCSEVENATTYMWTMIYPNGESESYFYGNGTRNVLLLSDMEGSHEVYVRAENLCGEGPQSIKKGFYVKKFVSGEGVPCQLRPAPSNDEDQLNIAAGKIELNKTGLIKVVPNPAYNSFMVFYPEDKKVVLELSDIQGRILKRQILNTIADNEIDISSIQTGMYIVTLRSDVLNFVDIIKIVK